MGRRATGDYCTGTCQVLSGTGPGGTTPQVISDPVKRREALAFTDVTAQSSSQSSSGSTSRGST